MEGNSKYYQFISQKCSNHGRRFQSLRNDDIININIFYVSMGVFNSYCKNTKRAGRMNEDLYRLIIDFQSNVQSALKSMYRSGIQRLC